MGLFEIFNTVRGMLGAPVEKSYVVRGATTSCIMGGMSSRLVLPRCHGVYLKGKPQLNILDHKPIINILPFGTCKIMKICIPAVLTPWINGKKDVLIDGKPALLDKSINFCMLGGVITIDDDGQE